MRGRIRRADLPLPGIQRRCQGPPWKCLLSAPRSAILSAEKAFLEQLVRQRIRDTVGQYLSQRTMFPKLQPFEYYLDFYFSHICLQSPQLLSYCYFQWTCPFIYLDNSFGKKLDSTLINGKSRIAPCNQKTTLQINTMKTKIVLSNNNQI